ncbi:MAG: hypothetical protein COA52_00750 [Hyphomicrobiales bacterium]|nr:MAG: hypothetical protein COA52_00750 [Hyphomicrobiales bacterium]
MENDPIYERLDLSPIPKTKTMKTIELIPFDKTSGETLEDDLDEARTNIRNLITQGDDALAELIALSTQSQDPKSYRELSNLIKVMLDANKNLVDNARARKEIVHDDKPAGDTHNTTNNLFVGTTSDAIKKLKDKNV